MNRLTVALLSALEAFIAAALVFGAALVTTTVLWAAQYGLGPDWAVFARAAGDAWLLGHGVSLAVTLDPSTVAALGAITIAPFRVGIAALGITLVVVLLAVRSGRRADRTGHPVTAVIAGVATYAVLGGIVFTASSSSGAQPSLWRSIVLPPLVYALGLAIGLLVERGVSGERMLALTRLRPASAHLIGVSLRAGTIAAALVLAAAAVVLALTIAVHFAGVVALYEGLQAGALGGAVLTLAQFAFLPNAVIWTASWLVGPGFAVGAGSSVTPLGSQLGPIPAIPLLGALPQGALALGFVGLAIPLLAGFAAMLLTHREVPREPSRRVLTAVVFGMVAGAELGLLAWFSGGALGPGRLQQVGPDPWLVAGFAAVEITVGALVGSIAAARRRTPPEALWAPDKP